MIDHPHIRYVTTMRTNPDNYKSCLSVRVYINNNKNSVLYSSKAILHRYRLSSIIKITKESTSRSSKKCAVYYYTHYPRR